MKGGVLIPDRVLDLMEEAPRGTAGITIWETSEGLWQVSVKRPGGSYSVQTGRTIEDAMDSFCHIDTVLKHAREAAVRTVLESEALKTRRGSDRRPDLFIPRRKFHPGD